MKKTTSFPREAKVADSRVFRLVNESIETKSLMLLQEADETDKADKVGVDQRGEYLAAFRKMQRLLKEAGFEKTASALTKGVALLEKNVPLANSDASAHFLTALIMMRSMQQLLNNIIMTVKVVPVTESRNLNDLDALHEELFSKSLRSILLEDPSDPSDPSEAPTTTTTAPPKRRIDRVERSPRRWVKRRRRPAAAPPAPASAPTVIKSPSDAPTAPPAAATAPPAAATAADDSDLPLGSKLNADLPILARYDEDGDYDKGATKELVQKLINQSFKPNPGFLKWLKTTKVGRTYDKLGQAWKDKEAKGAASEGLLDRRGSALNEGFFGSIGNFIKGIFAGDAPSVKSTVQSMLPLTGNVGIHKLLFEDLMKPAGSEPADRIRAINIAEAGIGTSIKSLAGSTPPTSTASAPAAAAPASGGGTASAPAAAAPASGGGGTASAPAAAAPASGGRDKTSIKTELSLSDGAKAKEVLDRVKNAKISVAGIGDSLDSGQKEKLAAALQGVEDAMRKNIDDTFTESHKAKNEDLIIERWQRLAGIIK